MAEASGSEISTTPRLEVSLTDAQRFNRVRARLNSFAPTEMFGAKIKIKEGKGATLVQKETQKREKPPLSEELPSGLPPAPDDEIKIQEQSDLPSAPTEQTEPPIDRPLPEKLTFGLGAVKAEEGKEVIHEEGALAAKQIEQEERDMYKYKWEKKDILLAPIVYKIAKRGLIRFHQNTIGQAAKFSKDRSQSVDMMAEAGLQYRSLPKEFRKELDEVVYGELMKRKFGRRVWWVGSNILHGLTWSSTELDDHRTEFLGKLRTAVIEMGEKSQDQYSEDTKNIIANHGTVLESYKKVLSGDYNAREEIIKRMVDDVGGNLIDAAAGEKKTILKLTDPNDPLRKFLMEEVIKPLLKEGISAGGITEKTRLRMKVKLDEFMTSRDFVDWWSKSDIKEVMDESLSFGNTIISSVEQEMLPQLKAAWDHQEFQDRFDDYLNNLPLEIAFGTVHRAQKEQMSLTRLEQLVSKGVDRKKVLEHYTALKDSAPSVISHTGDMVAASKNRAELIRNLGSRGRGRAFGAALAEAYWVAPIVAAVGISKTGAAALANGLAPIIGGAAVYSVWRAGQEMSLFNSNVAMHRIEKTLNYSFSDNARLRKESEKFRLHQRGMIDYTNKMKAAMEAENYKELLGYVSDIEARRQIQTEKKVTLFQASSWKDTSLQEKENTAMRTTAVKTRKALEEYFGQHPDVFNGLGFSNTQTFDQIMGELVQDFKNNILKGVVIDRLTNLGAGFILDKKEAIQEVEAVATRSKIWKGLSIGTFSFAASASGAIVIRPLINYALDQAVAHNVPVITDVLKWANWVRKEVIPGPQIPHEILSKPVGAPVEKTLVVGGKTIKTLVPDGVDWDPKWRPEAGKTDVWDLIAVKKDGTEVSLINDATFDAATGKMTGFDAVGSKIPKTAIEAFQNEFGLTSGGRSPDVDWVKKLTDLRNMSPGKTLEYGGYNFLLDGQNHLMITDMNGHEVAHNLIDFNPATKEFTYKAPPVNPIPEKLVAALKSAGLIKNSEEVYKNIHLLDTQGAETNLERIPGKVLNQLYEENKGQVHEFSDNVHWLAHGGWAKPAGEVIKFDSNEAINIPFEKWRPFPMTEVVDGKRVFSLSHFLNWWDKAEVINENQVRILTGPEAGKILDINPEPGRLPISQRWLKEAAQSHQTVLFDRLNKMASNAPKGFLDDLTAFKEGHGDPSRFALEVRFDPLSTKGVVQQFSGNSIWNAYADPSQVPGVFKDNLFMNERGDFRAWIHFIWTQKPGDYSEVYSLANSGPTEWVKIPLGNPMIDTSTPITPKLPFNDSISELIPTFQEVLKADVPGVIPWIPVRRPLEAPEQGLETQRQPARPTQQPRPQQPQRTQTTTHTQTRPTPVDAVRLKTLQREIKDAQKEADKLERKDVSKASNDVKVAHLTELAEKTRELEAKKREMKELENKLDKQQSEKDKNIKKALKKGKIASLESRIELTKGFIEKAKKSINENKKTHPERADIYQNELTFYEKKLVELTRQLKEETNEDEEKENVDNE